MVSLQALMRPVGPSPTMTSSPAPDPRLTETTSRLDAPATDWLTAAELAAQTGTSQRRVRQALQGRGRTASHGRARLYFSPADYQELLAAPRRTHTAPDSREAPGGVTSLPAETMHNLASQAVAEAEELRSELALRDRTAALEAQLQHERGRRQAAEDELGRLRDHLAKCYRLLAEVNGVTL